jgi:hypothetical protein
MWPSWAAGPAAARNRLCSWQWSPRAGRWWPCLIDRSFGHLHTGPGRFHLLLQGLHIVTGLIELGPGLVVAGLEGARIDGKQHVTGLDELVVTDGQGNDGAGHPGGDLNHVGPHLAVAGPGIGDIIAILEKDENDRNGDDQAGQEVFQVFFHHTLPSKRYQKRPDDDGINDHQPDKHQRRIEKVVR